MRSFKDQQGTTFAVAKGRNVAKDEEAAEVIDLIQLPSGCRPRPFAELEFDEVARSRQMDCSRYDECLGFAAHARWRSFSCRLCPRYLKDHQIEERDGEAVASVIQLR
jgi:hypothetical protein